MAYARTAAAEIQKRIKELDKDESRAMWAIGRMKADLAAAESDCAAIHLKRSQYEIMLGMLDLPEPTAVEIPVKKKHNTIGILA